MQIVLSLHTLVQASMNCHGPMCSLDGGRVVHQSLGATDTEEGQRHIDTREIA